MTVSWYLKPLSTPAVKRNCSHCGGPRAFTCSHKFRINAQQKNLDVWLIYQCEKCACSWNMPIFSRVRPEDLGRTLYEGLLENRPDLALKYAFDVDLLRRNSRACYDKVAYEVVGDKFSLEQLSKEDVTLHIKSPYNLHLRLDRLLREQLGLSRRTLESSLKSGAVTSDDFGFRTDKARIIIKGDMTLIFNRSAAEILGIF